MRLIINKGIPRFKFSGIVIMNGIKIQKSFMFPDHPLTMIENFALYIRSKFNKHKVNGNFEAGVYISHLRVTQTNDKILAVGLGNGATLIPIVKILRPNGFYRCIEASQTQIQVANNNILLNEIDQSKYEIINGFAGEKVFNSYGESINSNVNINNFDFDVLEMDCEGSEISIIKSLNVFPRNIIVELHPRHFEDKYKDFDAILSLLYDKGYSYLFSYGHNGDFLELDDVKKYYNSTTKTANNDSCNENRKKHFFGVCPVVVTFKRNYDN